MPEAVGPGRRGTVAPAHTAQAGRGAAAQALATWGLAPCRATAGTPALPRLPRPPGWEGRRVSAQPALTALPRRWGTVRSRPGAGPPAPPGLLPTHRGNRGSEQKPGQLRPATRVGRTRVRWRQSASRLLGRHLDVLVGRGLACALLRLPGFSL